MQQLGAEASKDVAEDRANPWTVHRKEEKFTCSYFSVRSDTVAHGTRLPRVYNSVRMTTSGVSVAPIDDDGCTMLVGQYRYVIDRFTWEVPGGGCRAGPGADRGSQNGIK